MDCFFLVGTDDLSGNRDADVALPRRQRRQKAPDVRAIDRLGQV